MKERKGVVEIGIGTDLTVSIGNDRVQGKEERGVEVVHQGKRSVEEAEIELGKMLKILKEDLGKETVIGK